VTFPLVLQGLGAATLGVGTILGAVVICARIEGALRGWRYSTARSEARRTLLEAARWLSEDEPTARLFDDLADGLSISEARDRWRKARAAQAAPLREQKDAAYAERDALVCALSKLFPASLERHPESDTTWDNDWRWIVFIDLPTGQATWHIHDSELGWFDHLKRYTGRQWDGHTTPEKYQRLAAIAAPPAAGGGE
jgi:hypothetical protein